ncbi:Sorting nexin-33 [Chelonia mydas]|uniref:Sorting nexin-33 n=1 Tax=Chelonia mydas TaxID=8469 RepID=M7B512_CHEMY|nr:Sorting nexin-33 [Chelonia mydas]
MALKARALYNFQSENKEEISIQENEELVIFSENSLDGWLQGKNSRGETGIFPASYVEILRSRSSSSYTDYSNSPASSPGNESFYIPPSNTNTSHQGSFEDDDDDDWDDWDDGCTVVEEPQGSPGTNGHPSPSLQYPAAYPHQNAGYRPKPALERQDSISSSKRGSVVGRNLNRFSCFVRSGVEAFILGDVPMMSKIAETYTIEMGSKGPQWRANPHPFICSVEEPTKQTKFKGIKSYISYKLTPSSIKAPVYRRYKQAAC